MFLALLPQLCARLSNSTKTYVEEAIYKILYNCTVNHPHHTLSQLIALQKSHDDLLCQEATKSQAHSQDIEPRVLGAKKMLSELAKVNSKLTQAIQQYDKMSTAMIRFAYNKKYPANQTSTINPNEEILKLQNLNAIQCPTVPLPISIDGCYDNLVTIVKWDAQLQLMTAANAPKKLECICSDGSKRKQLLKGNDDMRQDAVMQQVFNIMNLFLKNNPQAKAKNLNVQTYKVIPFSRRSGVLEWCESTLPLGSILDKYHRNCRPYGMDLRSARSTMDKYKNEPNQKKLSEFKSICKEVRPVFHHFLLSSFIVPGVWFEKKMAYTNSVATNSMIGYILGIGDRHVNK